MLMTLTSTKFVFFIVLVQLLWLIWQLEVSIVLYGEKWELSISVVSLGIFEFYFPRAQVNTHKEVALSRHGEKLLTGMLKHHTNKQI